MPAIRWLWERKICLKFNSVRGSQRQKTGHAQGVVADPKVLWDEIQMFRKAGITLDLLIDYRRIWLCLYHKALDAATENWKGAENRIVEIGNWLLLRRPE